MADEENFDIVKATQYGVLHRCVQLIENGYDVNQRDAENITLLHWAAINCRKDIVQYYIDHGAVVDAVGGELQSTPLHWATRQGHLSMVVLLTKHGADPTLRDGEGCSAIHLAAQFGYTPIVAYLLAKGVSPDLADRAGMTPLMWAVARVHSPDPARVIMTFGANTALQDRVHKNTALHMAISSKNSVAVSLLLQRNASLDIPNSAGETGYMLLKTLSNADWIGRKTIEGMLEKYNVATNRTLCSRLHKDKKAKYWITASAPFFIMLFLGELFAAGINIWLKVFILIAGALAFQKLGRPVYDEHFVSIFPVSVYFATKLWMYITYFVYITPVVSTFWTLLLISLSGVLWYNFLNAWRGDAGVIKLSQQERHQTIIDLAEMDGFDPKHFCTSCLVRKPMRSKHCSICDKCVARFDHHCPWLSNCVGWKNHKYFIGYLISLVLLCGVYVNGAMQFWDSECVAQTNWDFLSIVQCCPWINMMTMQAMVHGVWVFVLLSCQLYQILWLGMTTNERLNWSRYSYFQNSKGKGERTPFHNGWLRNFFDFFEMSCCGLVKVKKTDWARAFAPTNLQDRDYDQAVRDGLPLLTDKRDNYQYV